MADHNKLGQSGEDLACEYLVRKGFRVLERNWRSGHKELDLVMMDHDTVVVVEVKTRTTGQYGHPTDAISPMKIRRTVQAADAFLRFLRLDNPVRFDVIAIVGTGSAMHIEHIEDAFRPPLAGRRVR